MQNAVVRLSSILSQNCSLAWRPAGQIVPETSVDVSQNIETRKGTPESADSEDTKKKFSKKSLLEGQEKQTPAPARIRANSYSRRTPSAEHKESRLEGPMADHDEA